MVKFVGCLRRKPGMTLEEFHRYWKEVHAPLVRTVPEFFGYVRRYVQGHTVDASAAGLTGFDAPYDGFAELWFDSLEDMGKAFTAPRYLEIIRPDEQRFIDLRNCKVAIVEEAIMYAQ